MESIHVPVAKAFTLLLHDDTSLLLPSMSLDITATTSVEVCKACSTYVVHIISGGAGVVFFGGGKVP